MRIPLIEKVTVHIGTGESGERLKFDENGNFSFGIEEHTDFPGMKYDPSIGIYGMDVNVSIKRPGFRISSRKVEKHKIPMNHRLNKEDAISFLKEKYGAEVV
ncbi:MAG: hypothetical protein O8C64_02330 [Candidatus Methanoperedens sp.]|nr:hypothetical protein [Candidatus Methanoperedens sp.]